VRQRFVPLILVAALALSVLGTVALYANSQPDVYTSRAILSLSPRDTRFGSDNLELAASRYLAYLGSSSTLSQVGAEIGERPGVLANATEVIVQPATVNIAVSVTMPDRHRAARAANAVAALGLRQARSDRLVALELVVPGVIPKAPSGPPRRLLMIGGIGAALGLSVLAAAALGYFRDSPALGGGVPLRVPPTWRRRDQ
jgi:hypothetical protein